MNYRSRGFVTSADFGITAHESVGLPAPECLMVKELVPGGLNACDEDRKIGNVISLSVCYDSCVATN